MHVWWTNRNSSHKEQRQKSRIDGNTEPERKQITSNTENKTKTHEIDYVLFIELQVLCQITINTPFVLKTRNRIEET